MKAIIQRVSSATIYINNKHINSINNGLLILLGVQRGDTIEDLNYILKK